MATFALFLLAACSSSRDPGVEAPDGALADAQAGPGDARVSDSELGDQRVFQDINVSVLVSGFENDDDPDATVPTSLIEVRTGSGLWEDHVPGLRVFADDVELKGQTGAGVPQYYALALRRVGLFPARVTLEFRLEGATYSTTIAYLDARLVDPLPGEPVTADGEFVVRWTGLELTPTEISASSPCMVDFVTQTLSATEATLLATDRRPPDERSCTARLRGHWISEEELASTPFKRFSLRRSLGRTYEFELADN